MHFPESDPALKHSSAVKSTAHDHELQNAQSPHICIIGAGISGLRCAEHLIRHGIKVTIIEARDRVGGRVGSAKCISSLNIPLLTEYQIHQSDKLGYPADMQVTSYGSLNDANYLLEAQTGSTLLARILSCT
jgi:monoamine oxidase